MARLLNRCNEILNRYPNACFFFLISLLALYLRVPFWLNFDAIGLHFIRQTDSLSFMMGYYQFDAPFPEPRVYDILGKEGRAAAEFPVYYYAAALLAKLFGPHAQILRWLYFLTSLAGLWAFFRLCTDSLGRFIPAFLATLIPFSGTAYWYYSVGVVPDVTALSWTLIGWKCFYDAYAKDRKTAIWLAAGAFGLAGMIKISYLLNVLAIPVALFLIMPGSEYRSGLNRRQWLVRSGILVVLSAGLAVAWVLYARHYNELWGNWYYLMSAKPIWTLGWEQISAIADFVWVRWIWEFYHPWIWLMFLVFFLYQGLTIRRIYDFWPLINLVLLAGVLSFGLLFFAQLADHDYYLLTFLPFFAFLSLGFFMRLQKLRPGLSRSALLLIACGWILSLVFEHTGGKVRDRFVTPDAFSDPNQALKGFHDVLDSLQIPEDARFSVMGDPSGCGSLYFIRRQGYVLHDTSENQLEIFRKLVPHHQYRYALSYNGYGYGSLREEYGMELIFERDGIRVYRFP